MSKKENSYESLQAELTDILDALQREGDSLSIDETLKLHARGEKIIEEMTSFLNTAKNKIEKIK